MSDSKIIGAGSEAHYKQLETLREFCGADSIRYEDLGNMENHFLEKNGKTLLIKACYNKVDGGFLSVTGDKELRERTIKEIIK